MDWQSYTALGIVALTLAVFVWRIARSRKGKSSCGKNCGCGMAGNPPDGSRPDVTTSSPRGG